MSEVRRFADIEALSRAATGEFVALARDAIDRRGRFSVALAGGSTPRRVYELLSSPDHRAAVDWDRVEFSQQAPSRAPLDAETSKLLDAASHS